MLLKMLQKYIWKVYIMDDCIIHGSVIQHINTFEVKTQ